jgi:hypothetical protein
MRYLAFVPVAFAVALAGWSNWIFATHTASGIYDLWFWRGVAVTSALITAAGLPLIDYHRNRGDWPRVAAATLMLAISLGYDGLAAYSVERNKQDALLKVNEKHAVAVEQAKAQHARALALSEQLKDAPPVSQSEAGLSAVSALVSVSECKGAYGRNSLTRAAADRIRALCERLTTAKADHGRALAAVQARNSAVALGASYHALIEATPTDARNELLTPGQTAAATVLLIVVTALLGPFAVSSSIGTPAPAGGLGGKPKPVARKAEPAKKWQPVLSTLKRAMAGEKLPDKIALNDGWLECTSKRAFAEYAAINATKLHRLLKEDLPAGLEVEDGEKLRIRLH